MAYPAGVSNNTSIVSVTKVTLEMVLTDVPLETPRIYMRLEDQSVRILPLGETEGCLEVLLEKSAILLCLDGGHHLK